jgi:hypothetical protein
MLLKQADKVVPPEHVPTEKSPQKVTHDMEKLKKRQEKLQHLAEIQLRRKDVFSVEDFLHHMTNPTPDVYHKLQEQIIEYKINNITYLDSYTRQYVRTVLGMKN